MITLRVLGSMSLVSADGREVRSVTAQPKRLALLTYLTIESRTGTVRRDTVLALFWPELDTARARPALRQALYHLRRELGSEVLDGNGDDQLRVNFSLLRCDANEFTAALGSGDPERALSWYGGDLLQGLYVGECAEFDEWVDATRARILRQAVDAARELSRSALGAGRNDDAVRWARRAGELAPYDESLLRLLLETHEAAAEPGSAVLAYEAFAARYERELGLVPAPETLALLTRIRPEAPRSRVRRRTASFPDPVVEADGARRDGARLRAGLGMRWLAVSVVLLSASVGFAAVRRRHTTSSLDRQALVIVPFRVAASVPDSLLLAEGIAELFATALQSETAPRVLDPQLSAQRWRAAQQARPGDAGTTALDVARSLGAGLVVQGSAIERGGHLVLSASLTDVASGEVQARGTVEGATEDQVRLVQDLAGRTLGQWLREDPQRLDHLVSADYRAVRAYMSGRAAARRGKYEEAIVELDRALDIDSTFAAAALALVDVRGWAGRGDGGRYEQLAYRHREHLGPRDTAYLRSLIGYRAYTGWASTGDLMRASAVAAAALPDRPQALYQLGDRYFHTGDFLGMPRAAVRSRTLMERAVALDSGFDPAREHLLQLAILTDDAAAVRRYRRDQILREPTGTRTPALLWLAAQYLEDAKERRRLAAALDTMNPTSLAIVVRSAQEHGLGLQDAEKAMRRLLARAGTDVELRQAAASAEILYRNLGRPSEADRVRPLPPIGPETASGRLLRVVQLALAADTPIPSGAAAAAELERRAAVTPDGEVARRQRHLESYGSLCWNLWQGDTIGARGAIARFRDEPAFPDTVGGYNQISEREFRVAFLGALLERAAAKPGRGPGPALMLFDSLAREGVGPGDVALANTLLVKMFSEVGDLPRALAAARRRLRGVGNSLDWLAPMLRQEARLSAAVGERDAALAAYRQYLALRAHPEPLLRPQLDSVRTEYRQLRRMRR